jgi:SAM-dependent methyltransferase
VSLLGRAISKLVIGPIKYRAAGGYDAERYWSDRFRRYGSSLRGVGHEGLSDAANEAMYAEAAGLFKSVVEPLIDNGRPRALEIGCGTGFYTNLLQALGISDYTGLDITSALFESLRASHPGFRFVHADITKVRLEDEYDLVVMIDVTEHIVTRPALEAAIAHIKACVAAGGYVIIGPQFDTGAHHLFYVHFWSVDELDSQFDGWQMVQRPHFRGGRLLVYRKPV